MLFRHWKIVLAYVQLRCCSQTMHKLDQRLLRVLPHFNLPEEIKECNLCSRYLLLVFQAMFDDLNNENLIIFNFVDELNNECQASDINLSRRRSGDWIVLNASGQKKSPGFVEVKRLDFAQIHFKTNMDPVRLGTFSENAFDTHGGQNVLAIQSIGTNVTFFLIQHTSQGLYTMLELYHIRFPLSIDEIPSLCRSMDKLMDIVSAFGSHSVAESGLKLDGAQKQSLKSPILKMTTTTKIDRKRENHCQRHYV